MVTVCAPPSFDKSASLQPAPAPLTPAQRLALARLALAPQANITDLSREYGVSRAFIYRQLRCAHCALERAFLPQDPQPDVLFMLPVTRAWLHMFVLLLHFVCRASYRNIRCVMNLLLDTPISLGSIHNLLERTTTRVQELHQEEPLERARVGAHDEIYHAQRPILTGIDVPSGYCYLLQKHDQCDGDTWGVVLLELQDRGLDLDQVLADGGAGLRAGHREAGYDPPDYDHFHLLAAAHDMTRYLGSRARRLERARERLETRMRRAARDNKQGRYSSKLGAARRQAQQARTLCDEVRCLVEWLGQDILTPNALEVGTRRELYRWVIEELAVREPECAHRLGPVRRLLENVEEQALVFATRLAHELESVRRAHHLKDEELEQVVELVGIEDISKYWQRWSALRGVLGEKLEDALETVARVLGAVVRVSSEVESMHTRLRRGFRERRHVSQGYLDVQRFVLNHSRLERSRVSARQGRSPAEVLRDEQLPHWLEQLGYTLFKRAA